MSFVGILQSDSPAAFGMLKRIFSADTLQKIAEVYALCAASGGLEEMAIREPGVSFNPRPARLCQILLKEVTETDPKILTAAMLSCVKQLPERELIPGSHQIVNQLQNFPMVRQFEVERVAMTLLLDDIRHAHMTEISSSAIERILAAAKAALIKPSDGRNARLETLVKAAIPRLEEISDL